MQKYKNTFFIKGINLQEGTKTFNILFFFKSTKIGVTYVCCVMMCGEGAEGTCDVFFSRATRVVTAM